MGNQPPGERRGGISRRDVSATIVRPRTTQGGIQVQSAEQTLIEPSSDEHAFLRKLMLAALGGALSFGCGQCGTCENCSDRPPAVETPATSSAPVATTPPPKPSAPVAEEPDAGVDAAADAGKTEPPFLTQPSMVFSVRPPIPDGPHQSCGVYDGPVCRKECPKGNCRQDCDGVECELLCPFGYCRQLCGDHAKCRMTCTGGHCMQLCLKPEGCIKECSGGNCI
jgi:hypothetical protein